MAPSSSSSAHCSATSSSGGERKTIKIFGVFIDVTDSSSSSSTAAVDNIPAADIVIQPVANVPVVDGQADDYWKIKKILTQSDVDGSSRLLIGKKLVKDHIIPKTGELGEDGTQVNVFDMDTGSAHTMLLKMWKTKSYVFTNGWTEHFVRRRGLHKNDEIALRWEETDRRFEFSVLRRQ